MLIIPDISFYQDDPTTPQGVDFGVMAQHVKGVIIRAGQNTWTDKKFADHWQRAKQARLKRGSYWFYDSRIHPKRQAEIFSSLLQNDPPEMEAWADFEDTYGGQWGKWTDWYDFIENFRILSPDIKIGVYTGYYYWRERVQRESALHYFSSFPLWIANYNVSSPLIPPPWNTWRYWQYTDNGDGRKYGVESLNIDLNYFNGDEELFSQMYGENKAALVASFGGESVRYEV